MFLPLLLGAVVGLIMSMTGAGGGVLAVPLLVLFLHLGIHQAAPVALVAVGTAAVLGTVLGLREGIVRYRAAGLIGATAVVMAPIGVWLAHLMPAQPLMIGFALVLGWISLRMLRLGSGAAAPAPDAWCPCRIDPATGRFRWTVPCALVLAAIGCASGLMTGLLGVGGGFVIVPALTRTSDLGMRSIAGTSLGVIALATFSAFAAAAGHGSVDWRLAASFGGAAVVALVAGQRIARRLAGATLQRVFGAVSAVVALLMLARGLGVYPA